MTERDIGGGRENRKKRSTLRSRNVWVRGRRTSMRLERQMWQALHEIAQRAGCRIHDLCTLIQMYKHPNTSLTAGIRVFLMLYFRAAATDEGHGRAGHGSIREMTRRARVPWESLFTENSRGRLDTGLRRLSSRPSVNGQACVMGRHAH